MANFEQPTSEQLLDETIDARLTVIFIALCSILVAAQWLYPRGPYLTVVSNPFASQAAIIQIADQSDSQIINQGRLNWINNLYAPHGDAVQRLFSAGAILVIRNYAPTTCLQEMQI